MIEEAEKDTLSSSVDRISFGQRMNLISIATMPFKSYKLMIQGDKPGSQVGDEVIIAFSAHNFAHVVAPLADIEGTCADSHIATDWTQPSNSL